MKLSVKSYTANNVSPEPLIGAGFLYKNSAVMLPYYDKNRFPTHGSHLGSPKTSIYNNPGNTG